MNPRLASSNEASGPGGGIPDVDGAKPDIRPSVVAPNITDAPIGSITVSQRRRRDFGDIAGLAESMPP